VADKLTRNEYTAVPDSDREGNWLGRRHQKGGRNFWHIAPKRYIMHVRYQSFAEAGKFSGFAQFSVNFNMKNSREFILTQFQTLW